MTSLQCASITLNDQSGEIVVLQDALKIEGPGDHLISIDGGGKSRVFAHRGTANFEIENLAIINGFNDDDIGATGGCIHSSGDLTLRNSTVTGCIVSPPTALAYGGGVYVAGALHIYDSEISFSKAESTIEAFGGGAFVHGDLSMRHGFVDSNESGVALNGRGGGMEVVGLALIFDSTISHNKASTYGGIDLPGYGGPENSFIVNSTISHNEATAAFGGVWSETALTISNSTIAFNHAHFGGNGSYVGVLVRNAPLTIRSSIVSNNTDDDGSMSDLGGRGTATLTVTSSNNLVTSSNFQLPLDTITTCARLQPLADHGGGIPTHLPSAGSPALDVGLDGGLSSDERGLPRVASGVADIGAVERQASEIDDQIFASGVDELCYQ